MQDILNKLVAGNDLTKEEAMKAQELILTGQATVAQIACFLTALRMKGETLDEITGLAAVLREKANTISPKVDNYIDFVGTGGDRTNTFNISTTSAFVVAAAGLPVAKHGNRSISSKSGAGDVLEALGVNISADPQVVEKCVETVGIGFMFAPHFNPSMKYVGPVRKELGIRTVFNILGPLSNPSRAKKMMIGVYSPKLTGVIAGALMNLGVERGFVVSGDNNMDEMSLTGETTVSEIKDGQVTTYQVTPEQYGFKRCDTTDLQGGDGAVNAEIAKAILSGEEQGPKRDSVLLNAGAALYIGGMADSVEAGIRLAAKTIDSGKALDTLHAMVEATKEH
ncbi:MAG: anthranilate phosphoribosyltransferase [Lachnospiraceae bacterium]|nr:anthranilate phosphoribosyltransferase [Lachnospiraceae bacterium]